MSEACAALTVRHLLTMDAGAYTPGDLPLHHSNWEQAFLANPKLGSDHRFRYDSFCTYMLSAIMQKVTGKTVVQYLRERLFAPLGIDEADWQLSPSGVCTGGWGCASTLRPWPKSGK